MGSIHLQFSEDVLTMGIHRMDAAKPFRSNFLGRLSLCDSFQDLNLRRREPSRKIFLLLLKQDLRRSLADIATAL